MNGQGIPNANQLRSFEIKILIYIKFSQNLLSKTIFIFNQSVETNEY